MGDDTDDVFRRSGCVQTALMLPVMIIAMPAGSIADMYDRRIVGLVALSVDLCGATMLTLLN